MAEEPHPMTMHRNHGWTYTDRIRAETAGQTALAFYAEHYPHFSEASWREHLSHGEITCRNLPVSPEAVLVAGDVLNWNRPPWDEPAVPLDIPILYIDDDIIAVDKPVGLPVLPGGGFLENTLFHIIAQRYPAPISPSPVHRLGRGTSGLLLLARTEQSRRHLCAQFRDSTARRNGELLKLYRALTGPVPDLPDTVEITQPIGRVPHPRLGSVHAASPDGLPCCSRCRILSRTTAQTLWEIELVTGRPHQIRIHLAAIGAPLSGDPLYGPGGTPREDAGIPVALPGDLGYTLRSCSMRFVHPATGKIMELNAPIPDNLLGPGDATPE